MYEVERLMTPENETLIVMKNIHDAPKETQMAYLDDEHLLNWSMPSSSGRSQFYCTLLRHSERIGNSVCALKIKSDFWRRGSKEAGMEMVSDLNVELSQVLLSQVAMHALQVKMNEWLEGGYLFEIELSAIGEGDQKLIISLENDVNLLCTASKPAFVVNYSSGSVMQARWSFLVDQSCIRICTHEIQSTLTSISNRPTTRNI